jgi:hypothetical protein
VAEHSNDPRVTEDPLYREVEAIWEPLKKGLVLPYLEVFEGKENCGLDNLYFIVHSQHTAPLTALCDKGATPYEPEEKQESY